MLKMSFWRTFGFHAVSAVETILEKDSFTLEELLDEDELLQECKSQNQKLLDFLLRSDTLAKLLFYLTTDPPADSPSKSRQKYPYLACEILCLEVWDICEAIYDNTYLLDQLWAFLDANPPLSPATGSYISRVAGVLLQRKISESFSYLKSKDHIVLKFLNHIGNAAVNELLLKLIQCDETQEGSGIVKWMSEQNLIGLLVEKLDPALPAIVHENAGQALVDIVSSPSQACTLLVGQLESVETFQKLFDYINNSGTSKSALFWGLQVIIEVVKRDCGDDHEFKTFPFENLPIFVQVSGNNLKGLVSILRNENVEPLTTSAGTILPIGTHRLKVVEFFSALLHKNYECVDALFFDLGVFDVCLDMFFTYVWNNFLHAIVSEMVLHFLDVRSPNQSIRLITDCKLADRICEANECNMADVSKPKGFSRGYMGFVNRISNKLVEITESGQGPTSSFLKSHPRWINYVQIDLQKQNSDSQILLGGQKPSNDEGNQSSSGDEDAGSVGMANNELVNVFTQYLVKQGFTNDFPKDFLADEDEEYEEEEDGHGGIVFDKSFERVPENAYSTGESDEEENSGSLPGEDEDEEANPI